MDWSGVPGALILGLSAFALISLLFWGGHAVLNLLGDDSPLRRGRPPGNEFAKPISVGRDQKSSLESRERLATRQERDEVNQIAETRAPLKAGPV